MITQAAFVTVSLCTVEQRFTLGFHVSSHLQAQVITPLLSPGCVNGLQTEGFIFNVSGLVHISFQAWKRGQGPRSFTLFPLCHFPSASRGARALDSGCLQLCDAFKRRKLAVTEAWLSGCASETLVFFPLFLVLDICPVPSQCE